VLLENMGFDTSRLFYAIVVADPKTKGNRELRQNVVHTVNSRDPREATYSIDDAKIYLCRFNRVSAEKNLEWALEFWRSSRDAGLTSNQNKCARCEYQGECH
jgi:MoaA/NifB/PqqE/SkfB family radical SAM enzyme